MSRSYESNCDPVYQCRLCGDTGFLRGENPQGLECPGNGRCGIANCGRLGHPHYAHTYTRPCFCRATNPVLAELRTKANEKAAATAAARRATRAG